MNPLIQVIRGMRNGIYSFCVTSNGTTLNGIATVENETMRGFNSSNVYLPKRMIRRGKTSWNVKLYAYAPRRIVFLTEAVSRRYFEGEEAEDSFAFEGAADGDANIKVSIHGKWLFDLPGERQKVGGRAIRVVWRNG